MFFIGSQCFLLTANALIIDRQYFSFAVNDFHWQSICIYWPPSKSLDSQALCLTVNDIHRLPINNFRLWFFWLTVKRRFIETTFAMRIEVAAVFFACIRNIPKVSNKTKRNIRKLWTKTKCAWVLVWLLKREDINFYKMKPNFHALVFSFLFDKKFWKSIKESFFLMLRFGCARYVL